MPPPPEAAPARRDTRGRRLAIVFGCAAGTVALAAGAVAWWWHEIEMNPQRCVWEDVAHAPVPDLVPAATVTDSVAIEPATAHYYHPFNHDTRMDAERVIEMLTQHGFRVVEVRRGRAPVAGMTQGYSVPAAGEPETRSSGRWMRYELLARPHPACENPETGTVDLGERCIGATPVSQPQASHQFLITLPERYLMKPAFAGEKPREAPIYMTRLLIGGQTAGRVSARPPQGNKYGVQSHCQDSANWRKLLFHTVTSPTAHAVFPKEPRVDPVELDTISHPVAKDGKGLLYLVIFTPIVLAGLVLAAIFSSRAALRWVREAS
jgi:hypothetical protein